MEADTSITHSHNGVTDNTIFNHKEKLLTLVLAFGAVGKLPMTELMGFPPRWSFGPRSTTVTGGVHAQRSASPNCSVQSGVLSPGFIQRGDGVWKRTFAMARHYDDRLAHSSLIQRDLPSLHRHRTWRERRGVIQSAGWALSTEARASGPVWTTHTTMTHPPEQTNRTELNPPAGHSAMARSASDALPPTAELVGFRATQL